MAELLGLGEVLRGISVLYAIFALLCVGAAVYLGKGWIAKSVAAIAVLALFSFQPIASYLEQRDRLAAANAYSAAAWNYFRKLCAEKAGEKVNRTFTNVKSVFVSKPLPPATEKDLSDQFWYGDPYSNATPHEKRGESAALILASQSLPVAFGKLGVGFEFVESADSSSNKPTLRKYSNANGKGGSIEISNPTSRFAISWEDRSTLEDRKHWVARSHLTIVDQATGEVVAERVGFLIEPGFGSTAGQRRPWLAGRGPKTTCPAAHDYSDRWFVLKVLNPLGKQDAQ